MSAERSAVGVNTNIRVEVYDSNEAALGDAAPRETMRMHNVSCIGLHEYVPKLLDFQRDYETVVDHPDQIAFGDDATAFDATDTALNNRVGSVVLTDPSSVGASWSCSELVGTLELNGENLREIGVESEGGVLWNHAALPTPLEPKTSDDALIIDISISFSAPP